MSNIVVVQGANHIDRVPGLALIAADVELRFACTDDELMRHLPGADVLLGWEFANSHLHRVWQQASDLKWIQWCGAGVDALLFDELVSSDVMVSNMHGLFDQAMAEYALGLILAFAKSLPETLDYGRRRYWQYRETEMAAGQRVLVVGPGGIGRQIARTLSAIAMDVTLVGRSARSDKEFGSIASVDALPTLLGDADFVVLSMPSTGSTQGLFNAHLFGCMKPTARLINLGRGSAIDEPALVAALNSGQIAGAALDVFSEEPLSTSHPLWSMENVIVSPHMSGDFRGYKAQMVQIFIDNLRRYQAGKTPLNLVDKALGFSPQAT